MSGRKMSSVIAVGRYCRARASACLPARGHDALEALVARQPEQDPRIVRIVVDDEQDEVAVLRRSSRSSATSSSPATGRIGERRRLAGGRMP